MAKPIIFNGEVSGVSTRSDSTLSVRIATSEFSDAEAAVLLTLRKNALQVTLTPLNVELEEPLTVASEKDMPTVTVVSETDIPTPGERLRKVIYAMWCYDKEAGKAPKDSIFSPYYETKMNMLIEFCKKKLPPL